MNQKPRLYRSSTLLPKLDFPEIPPGDHDYFSHNFGHYALEARILYGKEHQWPSVLSIHGARADYSKANAVSFGLQQHGIGTLSFNMTGHNEVSPLRPSETNLNNNIHEALAFYDYLDATKPQVLIAYSLGGTPALKVLDAHQDRVAKVVLFYPAIYPKASYDKMFGEQFKAALNIPFAYRDNDLIEALERFKGRVLLIKGQFDGLDPVKYGKRAGTSVGEVEIGGVKYYSPIPKDVIDMVCDAVPEERRGYIEIPGCGHSVILWMREHPNEATHLIEQIADFIQH